MTESPKCDPEVLRYINETPELLSWLYDVDLLPEQTMNDLRQWTRTAMLTELHKRASLLERQLEEAKTESVNRLARIVALEDLEAHGTSICPMCGQSFMHQHSPEEIVIFKNGRKGAAAERDAAISALDEAQSLVVELRAEIASLRSDDAAHR